MNESAQKLIESRLYNLNKSPFRSSFYLKENEKNFMVELIIAWIKKNKD